MENTVSRNVSKTSPIFAPAIANAIVLGIVGAIFLFNYIPRPSTQTLSQIKNWK